MTPSSIVVFGEALVDLFKDGLVVGGAPFNVARHLAGLGCKPLFISAIGQDNAGDLVTQETQRFGLSPDGIQILPNMRTGVVQVHENEQGHQFEIMPNCAYDAIEASAALAAINNTNPQPSMLYHGTLGLRNSVSYQSYLALRNKLTKDANANVFLDVNWRAGHVEKAIAVKCLQDANVIKLSIEELQMVLAWFNIAVTSGNKLPNMGDTERAIQHLMINLKAHLLLVTYGDLGSAAFNRDGACLAAAKALINQPVTDTVGAGDAFSSVMLLALNQHWPLDQALQRANTFAADVCGIRGASPSDLGFYKKYMLAWNIEH
jgi:fructokinase